MVTCGLGTSVVSENLPSKSVTAAVLVPTTVMVAPITGSLSPADTTVPEILVCATAALTHSKNVAKHISSFLFIKLSSILTVFI